MSSHISVTQQERVIRVAIERPEKKNAITQEMYGAMAKAIVEYDSNDGAGMLIITGSNQYFTAGNDLADFATGPRGEGESPVAAFLNAISTCQKPILAAVNGPAIGIGLTMLLHCDLVYASDIATFNAPFIKLALVPEGASSILLPASVGMAVANDILLAGRTLSAEEAHNYGLVAQVFSDKDFDAEVSAIATTVSNYSLPAIRQSKSLIRGERDRIASQMAVEGALFRERLLSPDFAESVSALKEKRQPVYQ